MKGRTLFAVLGSLFLAGQAMSQEKPQDKDKAGAKPAAKTADAKGQAPAGGPSAEDMAKMMELATPGQEHAAMKPLVGNWTCDVSVTMTPGAPPDKSSGTMRREMILDGRYLSENYEGTWGEMPFKGHGLMGYDRAQNQYQAIWIDTMSTGMWHQIGKGDSAGKKITFEGENFDCMEGKKKWGKSTIEITSNDKHTMKMFTKGPDGKEFQNFEMTCTRK